MLLRIGGQLPLGQDFQAFGIKSRMQMIQRLGRDLRAGFGHAKALQHGPAEFAGGNTHFPRQPGTADDDGAQAVRGDQLFAHQIHHLSGHQRGQCNTLYPAGFGKACRLPFARQWGHLVARQHRPRRDGEAAHMMRGQGDEPAILGCGFEVAVYRRGGDQHPGLGQRHPFREAFGAGGLHEAPAVFALRALDETGNTIGIAGALRIYQHMRVIAVPEVGGTQVKDSHGKPSSTSLKPSPVPLRSTCSTPLSTSSRSKKASWSNK